MQVEEKRKNIKRKGLIIPKSREMSLLVTIK